jgi:hypothetical protein
MAEQEKTLWLNDIETAPIRPEQKFGPCLLSPGIDTKWTTGIWDGHGWFDEASGLKLQPKQYVLLPD